MTSWSDIFCSNWWQCSMVQNKTTNLSNWHDCVEQPYNCSALNVWQKYFSLESARWERCVSSQETAAKIRDSEGMELYNKDNHMSKYSNAVTFLKNPIQPGSKCRPKRVFLIDNVFLSLVKCQAMKAWVHEFWCQYSTNKTTASKSAQWHSHITLRERTHSNQFDWMLNGAQGQLDCSDGKLSLHSI